MTSSTIPWHGVAYDRTRGGISIFTGLAEANELACGLDRLRADVASGRIAEVGAAHPDDDGDYVLVVARKRDRP